MIAGKVWKFGDNIDSDLMMPGPMLYATEEAQKYAVFAANRPGWSRQVAPGDTIVAGRSFGMGSGRPAARSLRALGVGCVLAESVDGLFFRNAVNYGFIALDCPGVHAAFAEGDVARVSIETWRVVNETTGAALSITPVPATLLKLMTGGGVFPLLESLGLIAPLGPGA